MRKNESRALIGFAFALPFMLGAILFRYFLGYRYILYVDLGFFVILGFLILFYVKNQVPMVFKSIYAVFVTSIASGVILPSFERHSDFKDLLAGLSYVIPTLAFLLCMAFFRYRDVKFIKYKIKGLK